MLAHLYTVFRKISPSHSFHKVYMLISDFNTCVNGMEVLSDESFICDGTFHCSDQSDESADCCKFILVIHVFSTASLYGSIYLI